MKKNITILFLMAVLLTACGGKSPTVSLADTSWKLLSYGRTSAVSGFDGIISFASEGNLSGNVGCNNFSGSYEIVKNEIVTGPIMSTMMACEEPLMNQESAVLMLLNGTLGFEVNGDMLTIFAEDGSSEIELTRIEK